MNPTMNSQLTPLTDTLVRQFDHRPIDIRMRPDCVEADSVRRLESLVRILYKALETSHRYIQHIGANEVERGRPHPQAHIVVANESALAEWLTMQEEFK